MTHDAPRRFEQPDDYILSQEQAIKFSLDRQISPLRQARKYIEVATLKINELERQLRETEDAMRELEEKLRRTEDNRKDALTARISAQAEAKGKERELSTRLLRSLGARQVLSTLYDLEQQKPQDNSETDRHSAPTVASLRAEFHKWLNDQLCRPLGHELTPIFGDPEIRKHVDGLKGLHKPFSDGSPFSEERRTVRFRVVTPGWRVGDEIIELARLDPLPEEVPADTEATVEDADTEATVEGADTEAAVEDMEQTGSAGKETPEVPSLRDGNQSPGVSAQLPSPEDALVMLDKRNLHKPNPAAVEVLLEVLLNEDLTVDSAWTGKPGGRPNLSTIKKVARERGKKIVEAITGDETVRKQLLHRLEQLFPEKAPTAETSSITDEIG